MKKIILFIARGLLWISERFVRAATEFEISLGKDKKK